MCLQEPQTPLGRSCVLTTLFDHRGNKNDPIMISLQSPDERHDISTFTSENEKRLNKVLYVLKTETTTGVPEKQQRFAREHQSFLFSRIK